MASEIISFTFGIPQEGEEIRNEEEEDEQHLLPASPRNLQTRARRQTVSAEVYQVEDTGPKTFKKYAKSAEDVSALTKILESHYLFRHLDDRELGRLVDLFEPKSFNAGSTLSEDSESADKSFFYVILEGTVDVTVDGEKTRTIAAGGTLGETEMMYNQSREELYIAASEVRAFCIDRPTYQRTLHSTFATKRSLYCEFLKKVKFLEGLSRPEMIQLADCLEGMKFKAGDTLIHYNAPPEAMYIIMEGVVKVVGRNEKNEKIDVCEFTTGAIVGEMEFLHDHNNVADVVAKSEEVRAARLERKHFELCMGSLKDLLKSSRKEDPVYDYYRKKRAASTGSELAQDPESGFVIDVTSNRLPYTYAGQVKSIMKEGHDRITLNALGRAAEIAITAINRLKDSKLVVVIKVATYLSSRGVAGIRVTIDKALDFDTIAKDLDSEVPESEKVSANA